MKSKITEIKFSAKLEPKLFVVVYRGESPREYYHAYWATQSSVERLNTLICFNQIKLSAIYLYKNGIISTFRPAN